MNSSGVGGSAFRTWRPLRLVAYLTTSPMEVKEGASGWVEVGGFVMFTDVVWQIIRSKVEETGRRLRYVDMQNPRILLQRVH